jgi:multimeric flavodoxin WrbA
MIVMAKVDVRKGMPSVELDKAEFLKRFREQFYDPAFDKVSREIDSVAEVAWDGYHQYRKSPRTARAGEGYADPAYQLSEQWIAASKAVQTAEQRQKDPKSASRILLINGSSRSDQTCPGEMSKTYRLAVLAKEVVAKTGGFDVELLDLSLLASQYGRKIYPCKACVSTAQPLCHWPCSCYPNNAIGQTNDWMNEIYPKWVAAHGVMIVTPVNWYQSPSPLKLMIDRLVCADGGNPDPTSTHGKNAERAKEIELDGWPYPRHLAGRVFSVVVHGDASGTENLRRILSDWMEDIGMIPAGHLSHIDRYLGYLQPYATSHHDLDEDLDLQEDVRNAARALVEAVKLRRAGKLPAPDAGLHEPRQK